MTDDLDMGAILNTFSWEETIRRAVRAGNEMIMICHRLEAAEEALRVLEGMPAAELDPAVGGSGAVQGADGAAGGVLRGGAPAAGCRGLGPAGGDAGRGGGGASAAPRTGSGRRWRPTEWSIDAAAFRPEGEGVL